MAEIPPELVAQVRAAIIDVSRKHCAVSRDPVTGALVDRKSVV
jgi:septum formation topological specificity factor MinE